MKRYSSKTWKGKLDKLVGDFFRSRPCEHGGECKGRMEWAHIKSRRYLSTRWLHINAFSLCSKHHFYFTDHPDEFIKWIDKNYPGRLERLQKVFISNVTYKQYQFEELYEKLKEEFL